MNTVITIEHLAKSYNGPHGTTVKAVQDISIHIEKGEIFGILGPNGAGKTTTLEIVEGIKQQTSGRVTVLGLDNILESQTIKKRIGVQLQSSEYLPALTLIEHINLFAAIYGKRKDPLMLLRLVGLEDKAGATVKSLSGGQKQRFTLATTLVNDPEIIFLDEPTTGLDPRARRDLWGLIRQINNQGITVVLTTHYMEEAEFLCSRVAIVDHGTILKIGEPKALINDLAQTIQLSFLVDEHIDDNTWNRVHAEIVNSYNSYPKVILELRSLESISKVLDTLKQKQVNFSGFTVKTASLEDVYLRLTGKEYQE